MAMTEQQLLVQAVLSGDERETARMLDSGTQPDLQDETGWTVLMTAISSGCPLATIRILIQHGADVSFHDKEGRSPVSLSVSSRTYSRPLLRYLLKCGADTKGALGRLSHAEAIPVLAASGADFNESDENGESPLTAAIRRGSDETILRAFLENGADPKKKDGKGMDAESAVACYGSSGTSFGLFLRGEDVPVYDGYTPLMLASLHNPDTAILSWLVDHHADVNTKTRDGQTALMLAAMANPNVEVMRFLLGHGSDVNARNNHGTTALMMAAIDPFHTEKLSLLVSAGAAVNAQDNSGMTALMHAVQAYIRQDNITLLLSLGADTDIKDKRGRTAKDLATSPQARSLLTK